ncbi:MAG: hypothetical protein KGH65_03705 [Candidatus Micrarchaeota archaeon]|nr:hypothetical protein [Candidatus Micrarchaeota archaeon]
MRHTWRDAFISWLAILMLLALITWCHRANAMTRHQRWALWYAYQVGFPYSTTASAIIWQESSLCAHRIGTHHDYGCGGIQEGAVWAAWHMHVGRWALIHDDKLNIHITVAYFNYCLSQTHNWERAVICYNTGPAYAKRLSWHYVVHNAYLRRIKWRMREVSAINGATVEDLR